MSIYAVSERIGAYLGLKPEAFLYLHAGPLVGWKNLTGCVGKPHRVPWSEVPPALRVLPNFEVENLLCEFRRHLHPRMMPISTETDAFISSPNGSKACTCPGGLMRPGITRNKGERECVTTTQGRYALNPKYRSDRE